MSTHPDFRPQSHRRSTENILLNIGLYLGSLLIISAAGLLATSLATAPQQAFLLSALAALFYTAGLGTFRWVPKLRLASYAFTGTALALIPLCGFAFYTLIWPESGPLLWLLVSCIGTLAACGALALMQARVMSYLALAFLVSDVLAMSKNLQVALIWYFVALLVLATALTLWLRAFQDRMPTQLAAGFLDASRIFVPATVGAALFYTSLAPWEISIIAALATLYAGAQLKQPPTWLYYLQARIYSLLAVAALALWLHERSVISFPFSIPVALFLVASALVLAWARPPLPWRTDVDAWVTWALAQPFLASALAWLIDQMQAVPTFIDTAPTTPLVSFTQGNLSNTVLLGLLSLATCASLGLLAYRTRLSQHLPLGALALAWVGFFVLPPAPLAVTLILLGAFCLPAASSIAQEIDGSNATRLRPVRWTQFATHTLTAVAVLALGFVAGSPRYLGLILLTAGASTSYLLAELLLRSRAIKPVAPHRRLPVSQTFPFFALLAGLLGTTAAITMRPSVSLTFMAHTEPIGYGIHSLGLGVYTGLALCAALLTLSRALATRTMQGRAAAALISPYGADAPAQLRSPGSLAPVGLLTTFYVVVPLALIMLCAGPLPAKYTLLALAIAATGILAAIPLLSSPAHSHALVTFRIYLVGAAVVLMSFSSFTGRTRLLVFLSITALLAACSILLLSRRTPSQSPMECMVALCLSWVSAAVGLFLIDTDWNPATALGSLILLALALTWLRAPRTQGVLAAQSGLISVALTVGLATLLWGLTSLSTVAVLTWITASILVITTLGAALLPAAQAARPPVPGRVPLRVRPADPLGRWGYQRNRAMSLTGLIIAHFTGVYPYFADESLPLSLLLVLLFTLAWFLLVSPAARPAILLLGLNSLLLKTLLYHDMDNGVFYFFQALTLSCALLALVSRPDTLPIWMRAQPTGVPRQSNRPARLFWLAFGAQVFYSLLILPFNYPYLAPYDTILLLAATGTLLGASATVGKKLVPPLTALLLTYQVLYVLDGLNAWSLLFLGFVLMGLVIWRLLARAEEPAMQPQAQSQSQPQNQVPPQSQSNRETPVIPWAKHQ
ncbi:hypothetical protein [Rothia nasimurium]|uniref:hypothetical protein n=1 Tax=Rothia nasimurium TaxID=85336 RepID=UPI001F3AFF66|nr:hypothetical protein [Rothia nasimurium]